MQEVAGSVMVHRVTVGVAMVTVPVGVPVNCGVTVALNVTLDSDAEGRRRGGEEPGAGGARLLDREGLWAPDGEPAKLASPL